MNKPDARLLDPNTQDYLRQQAIRLRQQGKRFVDIASYLGVHRNTVSDWWQQYQELGEPALYQQQRGRKVGGGRPLTQEQETHVQERMQAHFPDELEIDSALWTRRAVQALIEQACGVELPIWTVGLYLWGWGYSPQKPLKRAYEQNPEAVEEWLERTYPQIEQRAKTEGAEIAWGEESGLRSAAQSGRGYAPIGNTPEIHLSQKKRVRVNFLASLSNQGSVRFMLYTSKLTEAVCLTFLKRLIAKREPKLFWIVDRHPVHRGKQVQQWLAEHTEQIELVLLPSYSPELNPTEYLNGDVKQGVHSKPPSPNLAQLKQRLISHLRKLQKLPSRIIKYFEHPCITYASNKMQAQLVPG
ncbi:IS630 family transposase [Leptothermofonsia sichuanensis E412]|nr:IS630 family transposase [Leptothermofonsia sichuanensis E412]